VGYRDDENVRVTSEETQAAIYADLVRYIVCDADVAQLNFFGYYDEPTRLGWQAALRRTDGSERAAHTAVAAAIAETGGQCWGPPRTWQPLRKPERAAVTFKPGVGIRAGTRRLSFVPTAAEEVSVTAGIVAAAVSDDALPALLAKVGTTDPKRRVELGVTGKLVARRSYTVAVTLASRLNPERVSTFRSRPFVVAPGFQRGQACQPARWAEYLADGFQCRRLLTTKRARRPAYRLTSLRR
jgi:hypothetical protein